MASPEKERKSPLFGAGKHRGNEGVLVATSEKGSGEGGEMEIWYLFEKGEGGGRAVS